jgi:hypothetical protein
VPVGGTHINNRRGANCHREIGTQALGYLRDNARSTDSCRLGVLGRDVGDGLTR